MDIWYCMEKGTFFILIDRIGGVIIHILSLEARGADNQQYLGQISSPPLPPQDLLFIQCFACIYTYRPEEGTRTHYRWL